MTDVEDVAGTATGAVEHVVDPEPELAPRRQQRRRVEVPLHGPLEADALPRLVERQAPSRARRRLRRTPAASARYALTPSEKLITGTPAAATFAYSSRLCGAT